MDKYGKVSVLFFNNGNTAIFNEEGKQINELQRSWIEVFVEFLESKGVSDIDVANSLLPDFLPLSDVYKHKRG